jgi:hypothetical protein
MRQIVANVEGHPRRPAAGDPEKPATVADGRRFCHGPESKVAFNALASGSAGCRHGTRPKPAHARDAAGMVAPSHRPDQPRWSRPLRLAASPRLGLPKRLPAATSCAKSTGQALAYIYIRASESDAMQAMVLTEDEARRIVVNIARLPELLRREVGDAGEPRRFISCGTVSPGRAAL